jgi:hypothetical protein
MPAMTCPTHFIVTSNNTVLAFDMETCDQCGCPAQAANAITMKASPSKMKSMGSKQLTEAPPELGYSDELNAAVCPTCYQKGLGVE